LKWQARPLGAAVLVVTLAVVVAVVTGDVIAVDSDFICDNINTDISGVDNLSATTTKTDTLQTVDGPHRANTIK
jgi:hypothetical protein